MVCQLLPANPTLGQQAPWSAPHSQQAPGQLLIASKGSAQGSLASRVTFLRFCESCQELSSSVLVYLDSPKVLPGCGTPSNLTACCGE